MRKGLQIKKIQSWHPIKRQLQLGLLCFALLFVAEIGRIHAVMHGYAALGFSQSDGAYYSPVPANLSPAALSAPVPAHFWAHIFNHAKGSVECANFDYLCCDYTLHAKAAVGLGGLDTAHRYLNFSPCQEKQQQAKAAFEARAPPFLRG